jgi:hypothetical protein
MNGSKIIKKSNKVFVLGDMGIGDMISMMGLLEYLSTFYDEVYASCREEFLKYFHQFHYYSPRIKPIVYKKEYIKSNGWIFPLDILSRINMEMDIVRIGYYAKRYEYTPTKVHDYPDSFYEECGISPEIGKKYFFIFYPPEIIKLYDELFEKYPKYIVVHQEGSTCNQDIISKRKININEKLVINVNKNMYDKNHKFYEIANKFLNLENPLWYAKLIEHSMEIYVVDSMIYTLSLFVDTSKIQRKICYHRSSPYILGNKGYEYIQLKEFINSDHKKEYKFADE